jgi:hypothetical protein
MKNYQHLIIVIVAALASCTNHKAQIVDQLRQAELNLKLAENIYSYDSVPGHLKIDNNFNAKIADDSRQLVDFQNVVDSLELELRKY